MIKYPPSGIAHTVRTVQALPKIKNIIFTMPKRNVPPPPCPPNFPNPSQRVLLYYYPACTSLRQSTMDSLPITHCYSDSNLVLHAAKYRQLGSLV